MDDGDYSDVVREAQEIVELALKGMLRQVGVERPKVHDVSKSLLENRSRYPKNIESQIDRLAEISSWLRKEREFSFYGDIDFIPTEEYTRKDAKFVVRIVQRVIPIKDE